MKPNATLPHTMPVADIKVGKRHRRDLGNIQSLAANINEIGLLHPIVVRPDGKLIAGERRLEACKTLGWAKVPVTVVDIAEIVRGECSENVFRENFLPSEIDAIRRTLEPAEKAAAKENQRQGGRGKKGAKVSQPFRAADKIGAFAGVSGRTIEKIAAVVEAAEADARFRPFVERMDSTKRVNGVYRQLRIAQQAETIRREAPPLPGHGPYRVIVADPPWPSLRIDDPSSRGVMMPYPLMTIEQICGLPVASIAHRDCVLWLWTTNYHLVTGGALAVCKAWGFEPKALLTWAKDKIGCGDWLRGQTEHCVLAIRGKPVVQLTNQSTLLTAPVGVHSAKPAAFYDMVERLCPAPRYATLFHRGPTHKNWDGHGDEIA